MKKLLILGLIFPVCVNGTSNQEIKDYVHKLNHVKWASGRVVSDGNNRDLIPKINLSKGEREFIFKMLGRYDMLKIRDEIVLDSLSEVVLLFLTIVGGLVISHKSSKSPSLSEYFKANQKLCGAYVFVLGCTLVNSCKLFFNARKWLMILSRQPEYASAFEDYPS